MNSHPGSKKLESYEHQQLKYVVFESEMLNATSLNDLHTISKHLQPQHQNHTKKHQQPTLLRQQHQNPHQQQLLGSGFKTTAKATEPVFLVYPLNSGSQEGNPWKLQEQKQHLDAKTLLIVYPQDYDTDNVVRQDSEDANFVRQTRQLNQTTTVPQDDSSCYVQTCDQTITGRQLSYSRFLLCFKKLTILI